MQAIMNLRIRQGGEIFRAMLSVGSIRHTRLFAASVCTAVPAAAVVIGHGRTLMRSMRHIYSTTNQRQCGCATCKA